MSRHIALIVLAGAALLTAAAAAWDAPRTPNRVVDFFAPGERFFLDTFAGGYQAVHLDAPTEEALRRTRNEPDFDAHVYHVVRHGDDFIHFRTASGETDVILTSTAIKRVSFRVERQFD
jgi:hypothetical protein